MNVRCAVCLCDKSEMKQCNLDTSNLKVKRTKYWFQHPYCRAHACSEHRVRVHSFFESGIKLSKFHNIARVNNKIERKRDKKITTTFR